MSLQAIDFLQNITLKPQVDDFYIVPLHSVKWNVGFGVDEETGEASANFVAAFQSAKADGKMAFAELLDQLLASTDEDLQAELKEALEFIGEYGMKGLRMDVFPMTELPNGVTTLHFNLFIPLPAVQNPA